MLWDALVFVVSFCYIYCDKKRGWVFVNASSGVPDQRPGLCKRCLTLSERTAFLLLGLNLKH